MSGRKNQILLRALSNSFRCESGAEHKKGEQCSKQDKINAQKDLDTASFVIAKSLVAFANKANFLGNRRSNIANMLVKS